MPFKLSLLTPLALAHRVMQDGGKSTSGGLYLCTDLYTPEDTIRLAKYLGKTYKLEITTPKAPGKKGALRIYIKVSSKVLLRSLIVEHVHPSMLYKLGL